MKHKCDNGQHRFRSIGRIDGKTMRRCKYCLRFKEKKEG